MTFKPLSYLEEEVKNKNIKGIRRSISSYIKKCLGNTDEIRQAVNYIEKSLTQSEFDSIWEEYDGLKLDRDKNNWNKSYFASLQGDLRYNFSKERFEHILEVGRYVYGITKSVTQKAVNESKDKNTPDKAKVYSKESNNSVNLTLLLVGGAILLLGIPLVVKMLKK